MNKEKPSLPNIFACIALDVIGMASYILPGVGESTDVVWACLSAIVFHTLFGGRFGMVGAGLNFLEEVFPFTDIIPSFTIAWFIRKREVDKWIDKKP
jgi:hypothetical protein